MVHTREPQSVLGKDGITRVAISGFKSISKEQSIEVKPLTILAGANSSGKSSMLHPLLLLKQTLEATYDAGALLLDGPNVKFTSGDQLLSRIGTGNRAKAFRIGIRVGTNTELITSFRRDPSKGFEIEESTIGRDNAEIRIHYDMTRDEVLSVSDNDILLHLSEEAGFEWSVVRNRCFLELSIRGNWGGTEISSEVSPVKTFEPYLRGLIHIPGLRGNPERTYPVTAIGPTFPGTFEKYVASVIAFWQTSQNRDKLERLNKDLEKTGLTSNVTSTQINDTQIELRVGRLTKLAKPGARDLVSIADAGFGVSQTLPVLVALHAAEPGQLVYLEQPEIHLHPRAQSAMAEVLADAANRGIRVIAETHSSLLLLGVQSLVAEGRLDADIVKLHWFKRSREGTTEVATADLDDAGAFGKWPEDFGQVALESESRYLNAAETRQRKDGHARKNLTTPRH